MVLAISVSSSYGATPGGSVRIRDNTTGFQTSPTLDINGHTSYSTTALAPGGHDFDATYLGDQSHAQSIARLHIDIDKQQTATSLTASRTTLVYGEQLTLTADVTAATNGPLGGSVVFQDGAISLDVVPVMNGRATLTRSDLDAGTHSLKAAYTNDPNALDSVSSASVAVVSKATTTTTLTVSSPAYVNHDVTLTATVAPQVGGVPTGTVSFRTQANTLLAAPVQIVGGRAVLTLRFTAVQTLNIHATYDGDPNFVTSSSANRSLPVIKAPTTVAIVSSLNPSFVGQSVTFTISVDSPIGPPPDEHVTVYGFAATPVTLMLVNGTASYTTSTLTASGHSITALYSGDASFAPNFRTISQTVNKYPTTIIVTSDVNPSTFGQRVTFTARVISAGGVPPNAPPEMVTFYGLASGTVTAPLLGGVAQVAATALQRGTHPVAASYPGDAMFAFRVTPASTTVTLTSSQNPTTRNSTVTFTATVSSAAGVPTGSVTLKVNGNGVASQQLTNGTALLSFRFTTRGTFAVTATFSGSTNFATATSAPAINEVVQ